MRPLSADGTNGKEDSMIDKEKTQTARTRPFAGWVAALLCAGISVFAFFAPALRCSLWENSFTLTPLQLVGAAGLRDGGALYTIPLLAKIAALLVPALALAGAVCLLFRRQRPAGWLLLAAAAAAVAEAAAMQGVLYAARAYHNAAGGAIRLLWGYYPALFGALAAGVLCLLSARRVRAEAAGLQGTALSDQALEQRRIRAKQVKGTLALLLGLIPAATFFMPYVTYSYQGGSYSLSAFTIITAAGLRVEGALIALPLAAKVAAACGVALSLAGIVLLLCRRAQLAGGAFALCALSPLSVLLTSSNIQAAFTALRLNGITIEYGLPFTLTLIGGLAAGILAVWTRGGEQLAESVFLVFSCVSAGSVAVITIYMITMGAPAVAEIGLFDFLFGAEWVPSQKTFGILPLILSSVAGTFGAVLLGVPIGLLTAVFLSEIARPRVASVVRPAVRLLAGIPSVIYGFFGMLVLLPALRALFPGKTIGESLLAVILLLAVMVLPTIVSVSETALRAVPQPYREASLALGATPVKTIFKVTVPAAKSGILAGVILGVGRAIGETMAVIMVAGNVANMPSLLGTVKLLTTGIVMEMSYSSGLHRQALFAIGLVLFVFIMIVNTAFTVISKKGVQMDVQ
jgi:phosphate ABC transporter permease protein PstC